MKNAMCFGIAAVVLAGCASALMPVVDQRVPTNLRAKEFNSVASQYMDRPTFVSMQQFEGKPPYINIVRDNYSSAPPSVSIYSARVQSDETNMPISLEGAKASGPIFSKYREWLEIATRDGDTLDKKIGEVDSINGGRVDFSFYSGNENTHYLVATYCMMVCLTDSAFYFDAENASLLEKLLSDFAAGDIEVTDYEAKYR